MGAPFTLPTDRRAKPARAGANGQLVYAIGDVHGRYDLLRDLVARIWHDWLAWGAGQRAVLLFCGDYIDRGPDSAAVIEALIWLREQGDFAVTLLKGNHEQALLRFIDDPVEGAEWLDFGGLETLASYGVAPPEAGAAGLRHARKALLEHMPASHLLVLQRLELMVTVGDYAFVHAGIRSGVPLAHQEEEDLLWIRDGFLDVERPFEKIIVHGHSWKSDRVDIHPHRIGVDTGGYHTGVLSAVRIDDDGIAVLQTIAADDRAAQPDMFRR